MTTVVQDRGKRFGKVLVVCLVLAIVFLDVGFTVLGDTGFWLVMAGGIFLVFTLILVWYVFEPFWVWLFDRIIGGVQTKP